MQRSGVKKERIWYAGSCTLTGCYTSNPHVLARYDIKDNDKNLALILSQFNKSNDLSYTLSCYCTEDFELHSPEPMLQTQIEISSIWSTYTAGGPIGCDSFDTNPQYSIFIPCSNTNRAQSADIQLSVSTTATAAVNVLLFPVQKLGDKVLNSTGGCIIDTGNYRHGFVVSNRATIPFGAYTLIVSNYHVSQTGFFTLKVSSSVENIKVEKI